MLQGSGGNRARTGNILLAKQVLYQLSYTPGWGSALFKRKLKCAIYGRLPSISFPEEGFKRLVSKLTLAFDLV